MPDGSGNLGRDCARHTDRVWGRAQRVIATLGGGPNGRGTRTRRRGLCLHNGALSGTMSGALVPATGRTIIPADASSASI